MLPCLVELEDLDRRSGGDLMPTLRALVLTGGNPPAAAEELGVHANTVRYRRTRIEDTTGLDLTDPETLFAVSLHLRAAATTEEATA
jgi:DNA-binding PucR family transcriptional regulator